MAGRCFKCTSNNCAVMGYHATIPQVASSNSSENEINSESSDMITPPQPGKYFLVTGKDFPFCRKYNLILYTYIYIYLSYGNLIKLMYLINKQKNYPYRATLSFYN